MSNMARCLSLAQSGHAELAHGCPLSGGKADVKRLPQWLLMTHLRTSAGISCLMLASVGCYSQAATLLSYDCHIGCVTIKSWHPGIQRNRVGVSLVGNV